MAQQLVYREIESEKKILRFWEKAQIKARSFDGTPCAVKAARTV